MRHHNPTGRHSRPRVLHLTAVLAVGALTLTGCAAHEVGTWPGASNTPSSAAVEVQQFAPPTDAASAIGAAENTFTHFTDAWNIVRVNPGANAGITDAFTSGSMAEWVSATAAQMQSDHITITGTPRHVIKTAQASTANTDGSQSVLLTVCTYNHGLAVTKAGTPVTDFPKVEKVDYTVLYNTTAQSWTVDRFDTYEVTDGC